MAAARLQLVILLLLSSLSLLSSLLLLLSFSHSGNSCPPIEQNECLKSTCVVHERWSVLYRDAGLTQRDVCADICCRRRVRHRCHGRVSRVYRITSCGSDTTTESGDVVLLLLWGTLAVTGRGKLLLRCPGQLSLAIPPWVGAMSTGDGYGHR